MTEIAVLRHFSLRTLCARWLNMTPAILTGPITYSANRFSSFTFLTSAWFLFLSTCIRRIGLRAHDDLFSHLNCRPTKIISIPLIRHQLPCFILIEWMTTDCSEFTSKEFVSLCECAYSDIALSWLESSPGYRRPCLYPDKMLFVKFC